MSNERTRKLALVRRIFAYILMVLATFGLLLITASSMLGYRFNIETKAVEQTGLVQYNSFPRGATVLVDGVVYDTTQTKGSVLPGEHEFTMRLDGYEDWRKTLSIESGTLTWLNYSRLVPKERQVDRVYTFKQLDAVKFSPKKSFALGFVYKKQTEPELVTIDIRDSKNVKAKNYQIDTTKLSGYDQPSVTHKIVIDKWNKSGRYLLAKHEYKLENGRLQREWLRFDKDDPTNFVNLSSLTGLNISTIFFAGSADELYFLQSNGDVRSLKVSSGTLSRPLLKNISSFDLFDGNKVVYVANRPHEKAIGVWKTDWQRSQDIKIFPAKMDKQLSVKISHYYHKDTVVFGVGSEITILRGDLPADKDSLTLFLKSAKTFTLGRPADLEINNEGRFVIARDATGFVSYDIERLSISDEVKISQKSGNRQLQWLDDFYLWTSDDQQNLVMQEFDGLNAHSLIRFSDSYDVALSQNGRYIYSFLRFPNGTVQLRQLNMRVEN